MKINITFFKILVLLVMPARITYAGFDISEVKGVSVSLAGEWRFKSDPQNRGASEAWYKTTLHDPLKLPGSCEEQGYGEKNINPASGRLTKMIRYEGPAWYQREIIIPQNWQGKRTELFLERCMWESTVWVDDKRIGALQ